MSQIKISKQNVSRSKKITLVLISSVLTFICAAYLLGWTNLLSVSSIEIIGAPTKESKLAITRALDIAPNEKLARLDPKALQNRLLSFDWIESSKVSRNWIERKISINISSRKPVALYSEPGKAQVVLDASGRTFNTPVELPLGLPRVSAKSVASGLAAIDLFTALPESFSAGIDRMSAARVDKFLIYGDFSGQRLRIIWGDSKDVVLKVEVVQELLKREENKNLRMIDVSAPSAPIVK